MVLDETALLPRLTAFTTALGWTHLISRARRRCDRPERKFRYISRGEGQTVRAPFSQALGIVKWFHKENSQEQIASEVDLT